MRAIEKIYLGQLRGFSFREKKRRKNNNIIVIVTVLMKILRKQNSVT